MSVNKRILITGGTGLIGTHLCELLLAEKFQVHILTRNPDLKGSGSVRYFPVDISRGYIHEGALDVDYVIHLAGHGLAREYWTKKVKLKILESRTRGTELLVREIRRKGPRIQFTLFGSATGYYGNSDGEKIFDEDATPGKGFLADVVSQWEAAMSGLESPHAVVRLGAVLTKRGGMLGKLTVPVRWGLFRFPDPGTSKSAGSTSKTFAG